MSRDGRMITIKLAQCSVDGCGRQARGLAEDVPMCGMHRQRWVKHGSPGLPDRRKSHDGKCTVTGCSTPVRSKNSPYCDAHYYRLRRNSQMGLSPKRNGCERCGKVLTKNQSRFCSTQCRWRFPRGTPDVKTCPMCAKEFTTRNRASYCGDKCVEEAQYAFGYLRRVRTRYEAPERFRRQEIFERDRWICQLCGERVNRRVDSRHPKAPSLDHIIPLSKGGLHTRANTQCTHLMCNFKKQGRPRGQLRMFG